jgi:hypothetical protein
LQILHSRRGWLVFFFLALGCFQRALLLLFYGFAIAVGRGIGFCRNT